MVGVFWGSFAWVPKAQAYFWFLPAFHDLRSARFPSRSNRQIRLNRDIRRFSSKVRRCFSGSLPWRSSAIRKNSERYFCSIGSIGRFSIRFGSKRWLRFPKTLASISSKVCSNACHKCTISNFCPISFRAKISSFFYREPDTFLSLHILVCILLLFCSIK